MWERQRGKGEEKEKGNANRKGKEFACHISIQSVRVAVFYTESAAELPQMSAEDVHIPQVCT